PRGQRFCAVREEICPGFVPPTSRSDQPVFLDGFFACAGSWLDSDGFTLRCARFRFAFSRRFLSALIAAGGGYRGFAQTSMKCLADFCEGTVLRALSGSIQ
ncbi:hypothetical protein, partial [Mesorhizobium sp. M3A.F.Ca.ET.175.01.1.1]|uniref:hypothetical protein n=1 Tax=Mesorhizobium sp. M3A.F.Ca.ET.175.01.1.1 TaxID=2563945 RepID=UPI001AEF2713